MDSKKIAHLEGLVITIFGFLIIIFSFQIVDNPIKINGFVGFLAQARFFPLLIGATITILGFIMLISKTIDEPNSISFGDFKRILILVASVAAYLVMVCYMSFILATGIYMLISLYCLNKGMKFSKILIVTVVFTACSAWLIPELLKISLPG